MKVISRKFTYDDFVSRVPGILPAIKDSWMIPSFYNCNSDSEDEEFFNYDNAVRMTGQYGISSSELVYNAKFYNIYDDIDNNINGNHGLVVSDVIIPNDGVTDYTDLYVNLPKEDGGFYDLSFPDDENDPHYEFNDVTKRFGIYSGGTDNKKEIKILKYWTLIKWYSFFKEYYRLINNPDNIRSYISATEYAKNENIIDIEPYVEMDRIFSARGGENMYKWICDNCIIQFNIPSAYTYEWKTTFLYYPQAVKWAKWFKERDDKYYNDDENGYAAIEASNNELPEDEKYLFVSTDEFCRTTDDCCDCNEFFRLGGHDFYVELKDWIDSIGEKDFSFATNSASLVIPINLQANIDDLGEMTILSNEWQSEVDYHNTLTEYNDLEENKIDGGTVVYLPYKINDENGKREYIEDTILIKNGDDKKGYYYDDVHFDARYKEDDWVRYTDYYVTNNQKEFASREITSYTFSPINNRIIYNPTDEKITSYIEPSIGKIVYINEKIYKVVENGKYVEMCYNGSSIANVNYKNGTKLPVVKDDVLEYVIFNGKKYYVEINDLGNEVVYFLKGYACEDDGCDVTTNKNYIMYNNTLYEAQGEYVSIDDGIQKKTYRILKGFFTYAGKMFFLTTDNKIVSLYISKYSDDGSELIFDFEEVSNQQYDSIGLKKMVVVDDKIKLYHKYDINTCVKVTGITESKLELLRRREITSDELGNELPGHFNDLFDPNSVESDFESEIYDKPVYNAPYDECTLDILYRAGEASCLKKNDFISEKENEPYFTGNIIESIEFYYPDENGNKINDNTMCGGFFANNDDALEVIDNCINCRKNYNGETPLSNNMRCDIVYYIGAIIKKNDTGYTIDKKYHCGIKYTDTLFVNKNVGRYYTDSDSFFTFNYYELLPDRTNKYSETYNISFDTMFSKFEVEPMLFYYNENAQSMSDVVANLDKFENRWDDCFNFMVGPVYRSEFNLAASTPQNVEANIYIDRGIMSAFEKHLKLQEFRTMEALENYGNNWFKIIK